MRRRKEEQPHSLGGSLHARRLFKRRHGLHVFGGVGADLAVCHARRIRGLSPHPYATETHVIPKNAGRLVIPNAPRVFRSDAYVKRLALQFSKGV